MSSAPPPSPPPASAPPATRKRRWPWVLLGILLVLGLAVAAGYAWLGSEAALRFVVQQGIARSGGALTLDEVHGSLLSTVTVKRVRYEHDTTLVTAENVRVTWSPRALLARTVRLSALDVERLDVRVGKSDDEPPQMPDSLALPIAVRVDAARVGTIDITRGTAHWTISGLRFAYDGGPSGHALHDVALTSEAGTLAGELSVGAHKPFPVRGALALRGTEALHRPVLDVTIGGNFEVVQLAAEGTAADATLRANATLAPLEKVVLQVFAVEAQRLDLHGLAASLPTTRLDLAIRGTGAEGFTFRGEATARNAVAGTIDVGRVPVVALSSRYTLTPEAIELAGLEATLNGGGRVQGSGTLLLATTGAPPGKSSWALRLRDVNARAIYGTLATTALSGTVNAELAAGRQHVVGDVRERELALAFDATVTGTRVAVARFSAQARGGELAGKGEFDWSDAQRFTVTADAQRFDPSRFGDFPAASVDAHVVAAGALKPAPAVQASLTLAPTTRVRGSPVQGSIAGLFGRDRVRDLVADLVVAGTTLSARGSFGTTGDGLAFTVTSADVKPLAPLAGSAWPKGLAGSVDARGRLEGSPTALGLVLDAQLRRFGVEQGSVATADVHVAVPAASGTSATAWRSRRLDVRAIATGLAFGGSRYDRASVEFAGTLADHQAKLALVGRDVDARAELQGAFTPGALVGSGPLGWSGTILSFVNGGTYPVQLLAPAQLAASPSRVSLQGARIAVADGTVRVANFAWTEGRITSRGEFTGVPVAAVARLAGVELPVRTTLVLGGDWDVAATPRLNGSVRIHRQNGDVYLGSTTALEAGEMALGLSELALEAQFQEDAVRAQAALRATRVGNIAAAVNLGRVEGAPPGRLRPTAPLEASITGRLASLQPFQPFLGTAAVVDGSLALDVKVGGTLETPTATGTLEARNVRLDAPKYGIHWTEGTGVAQLGGGRITLSDVSFVAGEGRFTIEGSAPLGSLRPRAGAVAEGARLTWHAEQFRATNRPDLRLVLSGDGTVGFAQGKVALRGAVRLDEGRIDFQRSPGATLSSDVVVVGRPRASPRTTFEDLPLALDLQVDLGRRLRVTGEGLRASLQGNVRVSTAAGGGLRLNGTVSTVDGTYLAFGQQLTIDRGRVIFDGPYDNPALDIVALRKNLPVEAGVAITGTARLPQIQLTSNPPVPEGEKLSWLVLGQGLERSTGADLAALQAAAGALFAGKGPAIGTRIAERIGLDDLSVRTTPGAAGTAGTQVLALSKRITDRLYLVFEQGLSLANNALRLEYLLTRSLTVRAQAGSNVSSLGLHFLRSFQ